MKLGSTKPKLALSAAQVAYVTQSTDGLHCVLFKMSRGHGIELINPTGDRLEGAPYVKRKGHLPDWQ
jgi:hypothetical protein